jgi:dUTPase
MIKVCLTENAIKVFQFLNIDVDSYLRGNGSGLDLYNMGNEVTVESRQKWIENGENSTLIPTGLRLDIPPNFIGLIVEKTSIVKTGLIVRNCNAVYNNSEEIFVNLLNLGDRDIQIATGAKLPLQLVIFPSYTSFQQVQFQNYIQNFSDKENQ